MGFPIALLLGGILSWKWPKATRWAVRSSAVLTGTSLVIIFVTGWWRGPGSLTTIHRWLPHGLFLLAWSMMPFSAGAAGVAVRRRPNAAAAYSLLPLLLLGILFLATATGYMGPSQGPINTMELERFYVLHRVLCPAIVAVLCVVWYFGYPLRFEKSLDGLPVSADSL